MVRSKPTHLISDIGIRAGRGGGEFITQGSNLVRSERRCSGSKTHMEPAQLEVALCFFVSRSHMLPIGQKLMFCQVRFDIFIVATTFRNEEGVRVVLAIFVRRPSWCSFADETQNEGAIGSCQLASRGS